MRSTRRAGSTTRCRSERAASACTTTRPSRSRGCSRSGAERVAYVDLDVHHGDGVAVRSSGTSRACCTISIHEYEHFLFFPGTGDLTERGGPDAPGSAINVPLPANTGDAAWLEALSTIVPRAVADFAPDVLVTQLGCDTHATDPLAQLQSHDARLSRDRARVTRHRARLGGRPLGARPAAAAIRWARVVPRAWTLVLRRDGRRRRSAGRAPRVVDRGARRLAQASRCRRRSRSRRSTPIVPTRTRVPWSRGSPTYCGPDGTHEARLHARARDELAESRAGSGPGRGDRCSG